MENRCMKVHPFLLKKKEIDLSMAYNEEYIKLDIQELGISLKLTQFVHANGLPWWHRQ